MGRPKKTATATEKPTKAPRAARGGRRGRPPKKMDADAPGLIEKTAGPESVVRRLALPALTSQQEAVSSARCDAAVVEATLGIAHSRINALDAMLKFGDAAKLERDVWVPAMLETYGGFSRDFIMAAYGPDAKFIDPTPAPIATPAQVAAVQAPAAPVAAPALAEVAKS